MAVVKFCKESSRTLWLQASEGTVPKFHILPRKWAKSGFGTVMDIHINTRNLLHTFSGICSLSPFSLPIEN